MCKWGWVGAPVRVGRPGVGDAVPVAVGQRGAPGVSRARLPLEWVNGRRTDGRWMSRLCSAGGISGDRRRRPIVRSGGRGDVRERFPKVNRACAIGKLR